MEREADGALALIASAPLDGEDSEGLDTPTYSGLLGAARSLGQHDQQAQEEEANLDYAEKPWP